MNYKCICHPSSQCVCRCMSEIDRFFFLFLFFFGHIIDGCGEVRHWERSTLFRWLFWGEGEEYQPSYPLLNPPPPSCPNPIPKFLPALSSRRTQMFTLQKTPSSDSGNCQHFGHEKGKNHFRQKQLALVVIVFQLMHLLSANVWDTICLPLFLPSLCVLIHLSALPSVCQSIHLSSSICHFSCHLNHPPISPSIFQAPHLFAFQCVPLSLTSPSCPLCVATFVVIRTPRRAELWWQLQSREPPVHSHAFTPARPNTPVSLTTQKHTQRCATSHDLLRVLLRARWAAPLTHTRGFQCDINRLCNFQGMSR